MASSLPSPPVVRKCRILWSTQSGRAKACARRACRVLQESTGVEVLHPGMSFDECQPSFSSVVSDMPDDCLVIMFVSTTGDGEHCDTIRHTWRNLLQKSLPRTQFQNKSFAMYCLGDRAYGPQFCAAGRKLAVRLMQLGMSRHCDVGYGDDNTPNGGVFVDLDDWLDNTLLKSLPSKSDTDDSSAALPPNNLVAGNCWYSVDVVPESNVSQERVSENDVLCHSIYAVYFQSYFTTVCPATAYRYTPTTTKRMAASTSAESQNSCEPPLCGRIVCNERITAEQWQQDTRHIRISLSSVETAGNNSKSHTHSGDAHEQLPYRAGDIATILPCNSDRNVDHFLNVLPTRVARQADTSLHISKTSTGEKYGATSWPERCTFRSWLKYCADIQSLPEREDLRSLAPHCSQFHPRGADQRAKLISLSETSESALFADYVLREKRSWTDVLLDFDSLRDDASSLTIEALLHLLPQMRSRDFSIASSPSLFSLQQQKEGQTRGKSTNSFDIELCVAVVEGTTPLGRSYHGLCSKYLSQQRPIMGDEAAASTLRTYTASTLRVWIRPGSFHGLPLAMRPGTDCQPRFAVPVLCIGAGTGIAPLRALIHERSAVKLSHDVSRVLESTVAESETGSDSVLIFGCRRKTKDYYYESEWAELSASGHLRLMTAFSRDQVQKLYVQKVLREADSGSFILEHLVQRKGAVYIAGGPKMARAVKEEIVEALRTAADGDERKANAFLSKLVRSGKFAVEAWS